MKIYIKILLTLLVILTLISCDNENEINNVILDPIPSASESINLSINNPLFFGKGGNVEYSTSITSPKNLDLQVITQGEGSVNPNSGLSYLLEGTTSGEGNIEIPTSFPNYTFDQTGAYTISVIGARLGEVTLDEDDMISSFVATGNDANFSSDEMTLTLYDRVPSLNEDGLNILLDWFDPANNDFDTEVIDSAFTAIFEDSATGSRYEGGLFDNTHPDGDYDLYITVWASGGVTDPITSDIPFRAFFTAPNGEKSLIEGAVPQGTLTNTRTPFVTFTKTGNVYTNIALF